MKKLSYANALSPVRVPRLTKQDRNNIEAVEQDRKIRNREEQKKINEARFNRKGKKGRY